MRATTNTNNVTQQRIQINETNTTPRASTVATASVHADAAMGELEKLARYVLSCGVFYV